MKKSVKPILAIETSGDLCSSAVFFDEDNFIEINIQAKHIHSEKLAIMIDQLLKNAKISAGDIGCVAISEGPGSFTGLRIGFAVGKGFAFGSSLPVISVPTFKALAYQISQTMNIGVNFIIANKVNVNELYFQKFQSTFNGLEELSELQIIESENLYSRINSDDIVFGNNEYVPSKGITSPNALFVAKWSYFFGNDLLSYDYDLLEPNYIKNFIAREKK